MAVSATESDGGENAVSTQATPEEIRAVRLAWAQVAAQPRKPRDYSPGHIIEHTYDTDRARMESCPPRNRSLITTSRSMLARSNIVQDQSGEISVATALLLQHVRLPCPPSADARHISAR
ncbi:MAG: hypothetical protein QOI07_4011 [Verrucomicrobiota bacterium]|jgi:hypothetical protein